MIRPLYSELVSTITFANSLTGVLADPTTVTLVVEGPAGTTTYTYLANAEITKSATGIYVGRFPLLYVGTWAYKWRGTGAIIGASYRILVTVNETEDD